MHATHPRGRIRPKDLARVRLDLSDAYGDDADKHPDVFTLEFRVGHSLLGRMQVTADRYREDVKIPAALRKKFEGVRGCIRWGRFDLDSKESVAGFWLEAPAADEKQLLQRVDLGLRDEPLWLRQVIRAQALLDAEFDGAALAEAQAALASRPAEPHALAIAAAARGVLRMRGLEDHRAITRAVLQATDKRHRTARRPRCDLDRPLPTGLKGRTARPRAGCGGD